MGASDRLSREKTWDVRSVAPRKTMRKRSALERFEDYAKIAVEDLGTVANATERSNEEQGKLEIAEKFKSIDDTRIWTKANMPTGKPVKPDKMVFKHNAR